MCQKMFLKKIKYSVFILCAFFFFQAIVVFAQEQKQEVQQEEKMKPRCSFNEDCQKEGMLGVCQAPGELVSKCIWLEKVEVPVSVIVPDNCRSCQSDVVLADLTAAFPGLKPKTLSANEKEAKELIKKFNISMLPAYVLNQEAEREDVLGRLKEIAEYSDGRYYLKPEFSGVSYFLDRKKEENRLDVFLMVTSPGMFRAIELAKELKLKKKNLKLYIQLVGTKSSQNQLYVSPGGEREIEESKIFSCIERYYPKKTLDYLSCRLLNIKSLWWEECLVGLGIDDQKIKKCAKSNEGQKLFESKAKLSDELEVHYAPLFLMENIEIFGISEKTAAEEIIKIIETP